MLQGSTGDLGMQALQGFQQQDGALAGIGGAANGTKQDQRSIGRQASLSLIAGGPHAQIDRIGDHLDRPVAHQSAAPSAVGEPVAGHTM